MIIEDYVNFETAKLLKEKGFDLNTLCKYVDKGGATETWYDDYREQMLRFDLDEGELIEPSIKPKDKYAVYGDTISAPTLQITMKWLREVHHYYIQVMLDSWACGGHMGYYVVIQKTDSDFNMMLHDAVDEVFYQTYEQACEAAIKYCLENLI